jgi:uncharacterized membrane protein YgaE (UPF0421/DUF939 family)
MQLRHVIVTLILIFLFCGKGYSQIDSAEITSKVPELIKFHDVIYLIWHEAYPAKNISELKSYVPQIKTDIENINNAKLPGILRDKEAKWKEGLVNLNKAAEDYYAAAEGTNDDALLTASENLHSNFEMMVRTLKPVLKEIDEYHKTLYLVIHKYFPDKKYSEISEVMDDMITKADAVMKVGDDKLVKRLPEKVGKYHTAAKELYDATVLLKETLGTNDNTKIDAAIDSMHSKYQKLESIFD